MKNSLRNFYRLLYLRFSRRCCRCGVIFSAALFLLMIYSCSSTPGPEAERLQSLCRKSASTELNDFRLLQSRYSAQQKDSLTECLIKTGRDTVLLQILPSHLNLALRGVPFETEKRYLYDWWEDWILPGLKADSFRLQWKYPLNENPRLHVKLMAGQWNSEWFTKRFQTGHDFVDTNTAPLYGELFFRDNFLNILWKK